MKDRILQLCKRLNKFTLDEIAIISEIPADNLFPVLNELICENKLSLEDNNDITLQNAVPIDETTAIQMTPYRFTIKNRL